MDAEFARQSAAAMRKNPSMTAEQMASGRGIFETFAPIFFAIGLTISVFGTGFVLWLVGKLFDAEGVRHCRVHDCHVLGSPATGADHH